MNATESRTVRRPRLVIGGIAIATLTLAACGSSTSASTTTTRSDLTGSITVSAASSLTAAFTQLGHHVPVHPSGDHRCVQLRFVGNAGHPDPTRGTGRRIRLGIPRGHADRAEV